MPIAPTFEVNVKDFVRSLHEFQSLSKRDFGTNLQINARGVLREALAVTPPNSITKGSDGEMESVSGGKKVGEAAIMADLYRIFFPASDGFMKKFLHANPDGSRYEGPREKGKTSLQGVQIKVLSLDEMRAYHKGRKNSKGRVAGGGKGGQLNLKRAEELKHGVRKADLPSLDYAIVSKKDFKAYADSMKAHVGWTAHGWGAAAADLKVKLSAYVSRHPSGNGSSQIVLGPDKFQIHLRNDIQWASDMTGYQRRLQYAVDRQTEKMRRRVEFDIKRRAAQTVGKS